MTTEHTPGDKWTNHYRGYRLQTNPDGDVWWQAYQGTDRLYLNPTPDGLVESLLDLKRLGGRVRVTEGNDVITKAEDGDEYETLWVGTASLTGELVPSDAPEFSLPLQPGGLNSGDFWPSVYDGAKYSFGPGVERVWWSNPETHKRHPVRTPLPGTVANTLSRYKPQGGSFRVTPWNDVVTLIDLDKIPAETRSDFDTLPRVVKNLIALRRDRGGVQKLPIYVGELDETPFTIDDPPSLTDPVSANQDGLDNWLDSLGTTTETDPDHHTVDGDTQDTPSDDTTAEGDSAVSGDQGPDIPADDPDDW